MVRFKSHSGRSCENTSPKVLKKIFNYKQIKYLKNSNKYIFNYYVTKDGYLFGDVPDIGGWNEYIFISKINVNNIKFSYAELYFDKDDLKYINKILQQI